MKKRLLETKAEMEELENEVKIAEAKVEEETQKYANKLTAILKKNKELRERKERAENEARLVQAEMPKLGEENKEGHVEMKPAPKSNGVDAVIAQELEDRQSEKSEQE